MLAKLRTELQTSRLWILGMVALVLGAAALLGLRPSALWLIVPLLGIGVFVLLQWPSAGLFALVPAALLLRVEIGTGSEVALNLATLLVPALLGIWLLDMMRRRELRLVPSATNRPLLLFLAASLLSLVIGIATWDPVVPRSDSLTIVQLAQWAIFAFSAVAFWLTGNLVRSEASLRRLAFLFLGLGGGIAIVVLPPVYPLVRPILSGAFMRAPFWMLLAAMAGGQLLFNRQLGRAWKMFLLAVLGAIALFAFFGMRETISFSVGVVAVAGILGWLRWPRLRWPVILMLAVLAVSGSLSSAVYEFAGGGGEWEESGGSRLALIGRVIEVTMRNPITGLGPAAYRPYAGMQPLLYGRAFWVNPLISSHNNYVDLFAHVGLLGMALFFWFAVEVARLGHRLRAHFTEGFVAGYVNGMLATGAGALVLMLFADWILPFVYNIGFPGFQASVLVWLFLGGLVALEQIMTRESAG